jgi:hypothetical protein
VTIPWFAVPDVTVARQTLPRGTIFPSILAGGSPSKPIDAPRPSP